MKSACLKIILLVQFLGCTIFNVKSQDSTVAFFDIIKDDSVVMYFSDSYNFTEKSCAENKRYTKINANGDFIDSFVDINSKNVIMGKGFYEEGLKNGNFETYYPNGQIRSKGRYKGDRPLGKWYYYYEDGKPERELLVNLADTFLIQFYDKNGVQTVVDGNGSFNGEIYANDRFFRNVIIAKGKIVNGKPDGVWESFYGKFPFCTEHFDKGVFLFGRHSSVVKGNEKYTAGSYLKTVFLPTYIQSLEDFRVFKCSSYKIDTVKKSPGVKQNATINLDQFWSYVKDVVDRNIDADARNGNISDYQPGENILKISFLVNEGGVPKDFKKLTYFGEQFYNSITEALRRYAKFPSADRTYYFVLTVIRSEENKVSYRYNFSNE